MVRLGMLATYEMVYRIIPPPADASEERVVDIEEVEVQAEPDIFNLVTSAIGSRSRPLISTILEVGDVGWMM